MSRAIASSGARSGTRARGVAAAIRDARSRVGLGAERHHQIDIRSQHGRRAFRQFASGHSLSARAVACSSTP
jgi:hypothetical protein